MLTASTLVRLALISGLVRCFGFLKRHERWSRLYHLLVVTALCPGKELVCVALNLPSTLSNKLLRREIMIGEYCYGAPIASRVEAVAHSYISPFVVAVEARQNQSSPG